MALHRVFNRGFIVSPAALTALVSISFLLAAMLVFPTISSATEKFETPVGFAVSPTGAATFSIPIEVPPGTAGMAPTLSLSYNSQGGSGMLGVGWGLSGLSAIFRCGRTIIQDSVNSGVGYTANDRFCLDGERLVVVANASGVTGVYGANLTEYRTERESFTRIVSYGSTGSGPTYFIAQTKDGHVIEFGNTADSRVEAQGKTDIRVWSVNKVSDTVGNYLTVSYTEDGTTLRTANANGDYYPLRVDYSGNAAAGLSPYNSVRFAYQTRPDNAPSYLGGSVIQTMLRLTNVKTYAKVNGVDTPVKDYRLVYANSAAPNNASRLVTETECLGDDSTCLPATTLGWLTATGTNSFVSGVAWDSLRVAGCTGTAICTLADFNGDGLADVLVENSTFSNDTTTIWPSVGYSTGTAFSGWVSLPSYVGPLGMAGDVNGDGKADVIFNGKVYLSTGSGFASGVAWDSLRVAGCTGTAICTLADFNGDGLADVLVENSTFSNDTTTIWPSVGYSTGTAFSGWVSLPSYVGPLGMAGDVNGDGKADVIFNGKVYLAQIPTPDLLNSVTTGLGNNTAINYQLISNSAVYAPDTGSVFPVRDLNVKVPLNVVSSATVPDGIGGTRTSTYKYYGAKMHLLGGGFLGFRQYDVTDSTGIKTTSVFTQNYPYQGLPTSVIQYQPNGNVLHSVANTWSFTTYPDTLLPIATAKGSKHHFSATTHSVEINKELDNSLVTQVTSDIDPVNGFDAYGDLLSVTTSTTDGYSKTITNTYVPPDLTKWYIGRLIRSTVQSTTP